MAGAAGVLEPIFKSVGGQRKIAGGLIVAMLMCLLAGWLARNGAVSGALYFSAMVLASIIVWVVILPVCIRSFGQIGARKSASLIRHDPAPCILAGQDGTVLQQNGPALEMFGVYGAASVQTALRGVIACPDLLVSEMQVAAQKAGFAQQDIPTSWGGLRLVVHRVGSRRWLWRVETPVGDMINKKSPPPMHVRDTVSPEGLSDGESFFDDLPVPLLKLARDGEILLSNQPARELLGVNESSSKSLGDVMEGLGRSISDWLDDAAAGRGSAHSEILRVRREDKEVFAQVTLNRARENDETVIVAVLNDATQFKSLEEQFVQSQKMQAIGQLAGGVAHDFNNLLTAITGHCDLLLLRHDEADSDFADLMQINQNANRAAALVSQLLAFSRKQTLRPETMDMRDTLADLTHLLNRLVGEKVRLLPTHDPDLWAIRADKRQLEQVIMNLVVNARDAMPKGGDIRIETRNLTLHAALPRARTVVAPGRYVSVTVADEGIGIPPDKIQKIFEPFFTTKRIGEGTGLGLSTAYGIIKQTGGFIFVDSTVGSGASFQLMLPAHDPNEIKAVPKQKQVAPHGPTEGVVLLVEDEAPVRAFASRALQMRGITVLEAETAEDALALLSDKDLRVDVFLSDVVMPGLDGPSWVQMALEYRPNTKVVFMSGYAEETFSDTQANIPNSIFLPKPFSLTELIELVQRQLA